MYNPKRHVTTQVSARNAILRCFTSDQIKRLAGERNERMRNGYATRNYMEELIHASWDLLALELRKEFEIVWKRAE